MEKNLVVKHNDLIEAKYDLNLNELKIILYAVSKLDREKEKFNLLTLNIREFFNLLGTTQERYSEIREIIKELRKKEIIGLPPTKRGNPPLRNKYSKNS